MYPGLLERRSLFHSLPLWWRHQMETFSALLSLCEGNSPAAGNSPHKGQWRGALVFSWIWAWTSGWANNRDSGYLRHNGTHYDITVMQGKFHFRAQQVKYGSSVYYFSRNKATWDQGQAECRKWNGDLVRIDNAAEHNYLKSRITASKKTPAFFDVSTCISVKIVTTSLFFC